MADVAFGANQDIQVAGGGGQIGGNMPVTQPSGASFAGLASQLSELGAKAVKQQNDQALGQDIASVNETLRGIDNPVEQDIRKKQFRDKLIAKYGADAIPHIDQGVTARKMGQKYDPSDGSLITYDKDTNIIISRQSPDAGSSVISHEISKIGTFQAEFPELSKVSESLVGMVQAKGVPIQYSDMQQLIHSGNDTVMSLHSDLDHLAALKANPNTTMDGLESAQKAMASKTIGNIITTLSMFNNGTIGAALSKGNALTPEAAMAAPRAYVNDITQHLRETGALDRFGIDTKTFTDLLGSQMKTLEESYKAQFEDKNALVTRTKVQMDALKTISQDKVWLDLAHTNPKLIEATVAAPGITAISNLITTTTLMGDKWGSLTSAQRNAVTPVLQFLEGARHQENNLKRLNENGLRNLSDVNSFIDMTHEVMTSTYAPAAHEEIERLWNQRYDAMEKIVKTETQGRNSLERMKTELEQYGIQLKKATSQLSTKDSKAEPGGTSAPSQWRATVQHLLELMNTPIGGGKPRTRPRPITPVPANNDQPTE